MRFDCGLWAFFLYVQSLFKVFFLSLHPLFKGFFLSLVALQGFLSISSRCSRVSFWCFGNIWYFGVVLFEGLMDLLSRVSYFFTSGLVFVSFYLHSLFKGIFSGIWYFVVVLVESFTPFA